MIAESKAIMGQSFCLNFAVSIAIDLLYLSAKETQAGFSSLSTPSVGITAYNQGRSVLDTKAPNLSRLTN